MGDLSREEFLTHIAYVRGDINEVKDHLAALNGRTRLVENKVAVLESQVETASQTGSDRTARVTGAGGALAALGALIWQWLQMRGQP